MALNYAGPLIHGFVFNKYIGKIFDDLQQFGKIIFLFPSLLYCKNTEYVLIDYVVGKASSQQ